MGKNCLQLELKPLGSGVYPTRLLLTSALDVRVVDLELTAQTLTQQFSLEFACAARQSITQDVPLVNTSSVQAMAVQATLEGRGFYISGPKDVSVSPASTAGFPLQFKPTQPGEHKGTLTLTILATGERNVYALTGRATEPLAEGHIIIETQARKPASRSLAVPNVGSSSGPVDYMVLCDIDNVSGSPTVKAAPGQAASYKVTACPQQAGTFLGSISFKSADGQTIWFVLEVKATEPDPVGNIQVSAKVHTAVDIKVPLSNPLTTTPVTLKISYSDPECLLGPTAFDLAPGGSGILEFYYAPLRAGRMAGTLKISNEELGDFWYQLQLTAEPAVPRALPEVSAPLGGGLKSPEGGGQILKVDNPVGRAMSLSATSSNPRVFKVYPTTAVIPPFGTINLSLDFLPLSIEILEQASIHIEGSDASSTSSPAAAAAAAASTSVSSSASSSTPICIWDYVATGRGAPPAPPKPGQAPATTLTAAVGSTGQGWVTWHNPFSEPVDVSVSLASPHPPEIVFALEEVHAEGGGGRGGGSYVTVQAYAALRIPATFRPTSVRPVETQVIITLVLTPGGDRLPPKTLTASPTYGSPGAPPLRWQLVVKGMTEALQPQRTLKGGGTGLSSSSPVAVATTTSGANPSAFKFRCKAKSIVEETMEVVLNGLASVGPEDVFSHTLVVPPELKQELIDSGALQVTLAMGSRLSRPDQPLTFAVRFAPQRAINAEVELVVTKSSGGRWRFDLQLQATKADLDAFVTIEAGVQQTRSVPIYLYGPSDPSAPPTTFTASFSSDTPLTFSVMPGRGTLAPSPRRGGSEEGEVAKEEGVSELSIGAASPSVDPSSSAALWVSYTCKEMVGKAIKGRLIIQTTAGGDGGGGVGSQQTYMVELRGGMPTYVPPLASRVAVTVDSRLSPELEARLKKAKEGTKKNVVAMNAQRLTGGGRK